MAFQSAFTDELLNRSDIVDIIGSYISLSTKGGRTWGLCPFHNEKTPSFNVNADKQLYYCFGCGKGGGVISFIMEMENLDYPDAVRFLAQRAGLEVPEDGQYVSSYVRKKAIYNINREAARFYFETLTGDSGKPGMDYLRGKRSLSIGSIKNFGLGYAPDSWDALAQAMSGKGYSFDDLVDSGLASWRKDKKSVYDRFRARVMFPIIDVTGNVIGFSGRVLDGSEPKYVNSPETIAYSKGNNLYGLNIAKKSKAGRIILAEGNLDVISLHQAGFDSAVATCGTALTEQQVKLISKYSKEVIIAYDGDEAGTKASQKALNLLSKADLSIKVLNLGDCKDPDEYIKAHGANGFIKLIERAEGHIEYQLNIVMNKYDLSQNEQRVAFIKEATALIAALPNAVEREVYGASAAEAASVSAEALKTEVESARKRRQYKDNKKQEKSSLNPAESIQPKARELKYTNLKSARAEETLIRLVCSDPSLYDTARELEAEDFSSGLLGRAFISLRHRCEQGLEANIPALEGEFSGEEVSHLVAVMQQDEELQNGAVAAEDCVKIIKAESEKSRSGSAEERLRAIYESKRRSMEG